MGSVGAGTPPHARGVTCEECPGPPINRAGALGYSRREHRLVPLRSPGGIPTIEMEAIVAMNCAHCRERIDEQSVSIFRHGKSWHPSCYNIAHDLFQKADQRLANELGLRREDLARVKTRP